MAGEGGRDCGHLRVAVGSRKYVGSTPAARVELENTTFFLILSSLFRKGLWMLGSVPLTSAVKPNVKLANRIHINGNALYHVGSAAFVDFLQRVRDNKAPVEAWQVCVETARKPS